MEVDKYLHSRSRAPDADPPSDAFSLSHALAYPRAVTWARTSRPTVQRSGGRGAGHRCQPGDPEGRPRRPREELRHRRRLHRAVLLPHGTDAIRGGAVPGARLQTPGSLVARATRPGNQSAPSWSLDKSCA